MPDRSLVGLMICGRLALGCGGPSASIFPPVQFPAPPSALAHDASGGVVLESRGRIQFLAPAADGTSGPRAPYAVVRRETALLVTGTQVDPGLQVRRFAQNRTSTLRLARARVARQDGTAVEVDGLAVSDAAGGADVVLTLPALAPGDRVDVVSESVWLRPEAISPYVFADAAPSAVATLEIVAPRDFDVRIRTGQGAKEDHGALIPARETSGGHRSWTIRHANVLGVPTEPEAVPAQRLAPWATVVLARAAGPNGGAALADSWQTVADRVRAALTDTVALAAAERAEFGRGLAKARIKAIRRRLQPASEPRGLLEVPPRKLAAVLAGGATTLESAALIEAACADSLEKGTLALLAPLAGPMLHDDLPGLYAFQSAGVAFRLGGDWVFADPSCAACELGEVSMEVAGGRALVLTSPPTIVDIPAGVAGPNRRRLQFDWTLAVDGQLHGRLLVDFEGDAARAVEVAAPSTLAAAERRAALARMLFGGDSPIRVVAVDDERGNAASGAVSMALEVTAPTIIKGDGRFEVTSAVVAPAGIGLPQLAGRRTDVLLAAPVSVEVTASVDLPQVFVGVTPADADQHSAVGEGSVRYTSRGETITVRRRLGLFTRSVPVSRLAPLVGFAEQMLASERAVLSIQGD
ncbi:MAG: hypothetical protein HY903_10170 [Deltaproteobacteria bacterium]|nr:hypothetical protein [Deltaproteobacteria bacterium]